MTQQIDQAHSPEEGGYSDFNVSKLLERFLPEMDLLEGLMVHCRYSEEEAVSVIWELSLAQEYGSHQIIFEVIMALHHSIGGGGAARGEGVFVAAGAASPQLINGGQPGVRGGLGRIRNLLSRDRTPVGAASGESEQ